MPVIFGAIATKKECQQTAGAVMSTLGFVTDATSRDR